MLSKLGEMFVIVTSLS